jgi:hypothetical protein
MCMRLGAKEQARRMIRPAARPPVTPGKTAGLGVAGVVIAGALLASWVGFDWSSHSRHRGRTLPRLVIAQSWSSSKPWAATGASTVASSDTG